MLFQIDSCGGAAATDNTLKGAAAAAAVDGNNEPSEPSVPTNTGESPWKRQLPGHVLLRSTHAGDCRALWFAEQQGANKMEPSSKFETKLPDSEFDQSQVITCWGRSASSLEFRRPRSHVKSFLRNADHRLSPRLNLNETAHFFTFTGVHIDCTALRESSRC